MSEQPHNDRPAASNRTVELVVAALVFLFGLIVIVDSLRLGFGWAADGPQAGYFPFYIGLLICISSGVVFVAGLRNTQLAQKPFVMRGQLALIMKLLLPSIVYALLIGGIEVGPIHWGGLGIYVASTLFIAYFMLRIGGYSIAKTVPVAFGVSLFFFLVFELWFKVPLPKGPLETLLGFN
jgi:putative tricarboxylic transport membrane protein